MSDRKPAKISEPWRLHLPMAHGYVEALLDEPPGARRATVVLHGGGSAMTDEVVVRVARALHAQDSVVLRFNFRGVGGLTGVFYADGGQGEREDTRAALDFLAERHPYLPLWLTGVSFGAWVGLQTAMDDPRVEALLGVALPIRMRQFDLSFLKGKRSKPLAVVQAADDEYGPRPEIEAFVDRLPEPKSRFHVAGATHDFHGQLPALDSALDRAVSWLAHTTEQAHAQASPQPSVSR